MLYHDVKYLKLVSYRLERFKIKKDNGNMFEANCRCPICGDSQTNLKKARGYFYSKQGKMNFYCHNCNASMSFSKWLKDFDYNTYQMYALDVFKDQKEKTDYIAELKTKPYVPSVLRGLKTIKQLHDAQHPAASYVVNRKIPEKYWEELYYVPKFFEWTLGHTDKFKDLLNVHPEREHPRLIIPWFTEDDKECFAYQARAFGKEEPKYYAITVDKKPPRFFGLDRLNRLEHIYVVEGPIDSLFLPNAVAVGSSALYTFEDAGADITYVPDNENRNKEILKVYKKIIDAGHKVCIMPNTYTYKDINEAIMCGMSIFDIKQLIDDNTYSGLSAHMKFNEWRKLDVS